MTARERLRRAVFVRFVPACAITLASAIGGLALIAPDQITWLSVARLLAEFLGLTGGFAAALMLAGPRLATMPRVEVRSVAAGLLAPLLAGLASWLEPQATLPVIPLLSMLAGAAAAVPVTPRLLRFRVRRIGLAGDPQTQY